MATKKVLTIDSLKKKLTGPKISLAKDAFEVLWSESQKLWTPAGKQTAKAKKISELISNIPTETSTKKGIANLISFITGEKDLYKEAVIKNGMFVKVKNNDNGHSYPLNKALFMIDHSSGDVALYYDEATKRVRMGNHLPTDDQTAFVKPTKAEAKALALKFADKHLSKILGVSDSDWYGLV